MFTKRLIATLIGVCTVVAAPPTTGFAGQISLAEDGKRKINISGKNRMLSQRMAKAVCFASIGVDAPEHLQMAGDAHQEFAKALAGLRHGDEELGILPESAPSILAELDGVDELWATYGATVAAVTGTGEIAADDLAKVSSLSVPTLVQMNKAVGEFEKRYGSADLHPSLALAINVSGRQRMLSQKSSKEFCLTLAARESAENRKALSATIELFETSLLALMDGDDGLGLPEAPTDEIYEQLELVQDLWTPVAEVFKTVVDGGQPSADQIAFVAEQNNAVLVEMNKAVGMYASL